MEFPKRINRVTLLHVTGLSWSLVHLVQFLIYTLCFYNSDHVLIITDSLQLKYSMDANNLKGICGVTDLPELNHNDFIGANEFYENTRVYQ